MNRRFEKDRAVFALIALGAVTLIASGCSAKQDQGRLVSTAEAQAMQDAGKTRIENDSTLSEKTRTAMLKARARGLERAGSETHPPPPPGK